MNNSKPQEDIQLKLNYKRTFIIGFAFFGILLLWQVYDSRCPTFLTELFTKALNAKSEKEVQYLVGIVMALDNLAAIIMLPIFGHLSDKTHTKIGKRMPYILIGTFACAIAFPFIPVAFHFNNLAGTISVMAIVVFFAMMYRNPAVSLMPDITPKPLRSKANGIINIMGYLGGACATLVGLVFVLNDFLGTKGYKEGITGNIWIIEAPFLIGSILMVISCLILFFTVKENKLEEELKPELELGEKLSEVKGQIADENQKLSKENFIMLLLILAAEFFWFMADNGVGTFMNNYTIYHLHASTKYNMINIIVGGIGSVIGFALGGTIASKIGRKWTVVGGLGLTVISLLGWSLCSILIPINGGFPTYIFLVWFFKGLGMSLVHVNSFPMVVELCTSKKIGKFTGYYYAASMTAQTITPVLLGLLMLNPSFDFGILPWYALICSSISLIIFIFIKNVKSTKTTFKKGLEALDQED